MLKFDIRKKILSIFIVGSVLFLILGISGIFATMKLSKLSATQSGYFNEAITAENLHKLNIMLNLVAMDIIVDKNDGVISDERLQEIENIDAEIKQYKTTIIGYAENEEEKKQLESVFVNFDKLLKLIKTDLKNAVENRAGNAEFDAFDNIIDGTSTKIEDLLSTKLEAISVKVKQANAAANSVSSKSLTSSVIMLIVILLVNSAISFFVASSIIKSIKTIIITAKDLAEGEGDLTKTIVVKTDDETKQLADYINIFIGNVKKIVETIQVSSESVSAGNNELAASAEELTTNMEHQTSQVADIAAMVEEMAATSKEISENVGEVLHKSQETNSLTETGKSKLDKAVHDIEEIRRQIEEMSNIISQLADSSVKIGDILDVINDIADQTNLLALNAAIEAARAGEAGRGFAVVADEVRKLAERTQSATGEVGSIITSLQRETDTASKNMNSAISVVHTGVTAITETSEIFDNIMVSVRDISLNNSAVSSAIDEESKAISSVNDNVQMISSGLEQSNIALSEISHTISDLQKQAEEQHQVVSRFKVV
jgi:methyl-accepting chemotaxis protein